MTLPIKRGSNSDKALALAAGTAGKDPAADRGQVETATAAALLQILALSDKDIEAGRVRPVAEAVARLRGQPSNARQTRSSSWPRA